MDFLIFLTVSCLLSLGSCAVLEDLESVFEKHGMMGMSIASICGGTIHDVHHIGLKDYSRNLPVDGDTMYRIASISKLVTTTGLMTLFDDGLFNIDDDISDRLGYLVRNPNWPDVPITYRMLLSHTSSLQDGTGYDAFLSATVGSLGTPPSLSEILLPGGSFFTDDIWRAQMPGTYFIYCNLNFGIVGTLIEALTSQRFDVFMKERILNPLRISGSYNVRDLESIDDVAVLYRNQDGWTPQYDDYQGVKPEPVNMTLYVPGTNGLQFSPTGGLRISALDLVKILAVHVSNGTFQNQQVLSPRAVLLMREAQWQYNGDNGVTEGGLYQAWGLGMHHATNSQSGDSVFPDRYMYGHMGDAYGLVSDIYFDPITQTGLVFMTNGLYNGLTFGVDTAFYEVEEDVFRAVFSNLPC